MAPSKRNEFHVGDTVYASDWCYGGIVRIDGIIAWVEVDTGTGGGTCAFELSELRRANNG